MGGLQCKFIMNFKFINSKKHNWKKKYINKVSIYYIGRYKSIEKLFSYIERSPILELFEIKEIAKEMTGNFSVVIESSEKIFALVDRISGYCVFYQNCGNVLKLSNSPYLLDLINNKQEFFHNKESIIEMNMLGYLTGERTLDKSIKQLGAGEIISCNNVSYTVSSYFKFYDKKNINEKNSILIDELDNVTNKIFKRNIEDANGRVIWVPLSGGLDSRLVVCKLKQLGYDNIRTYSYGINGNYDAMRAKHISKKLGLDWNFVPTSNDNAREYFLSSNRKDYWNFADGLSVVPNLHGMFALNKLVSLGIMKPDDVVINGQSGDFITGQHIPVIENDDFSTDKLVSLILNKHYSLNKNMSNDCNMVHLMRQRIKESLGKYESVSNYQELAKSYEYWEWKERQTKRVINGQHNYDYFRLDWNLPLWDVEYLDFWMRIPLQQKINRCLFVEYLEKMNFYGLFNGKDFFMSRWPSDRIYIQFIGNFFKKVFGENISNKYYSKLDWYSQYQYLYAMTGKGEYNKNWSNYKGPIPYMVDVWLKERLMDKIYEK